MHTHIVKDNLRDIKIDDNELDFIKAAESFIKWRGVLMKFIDEYPLNENQTDFKKDKADESFGIWLKGIGFENYGQNKSFSRLAESHFEFYHVVDMIVDKAKIGDLKSAESLIRESLAQLTRRVFTDLNEFHTELARVTE